MSFTLEERVEQAASRARSRLEAGENVGEVLRAFREDDELGPLESIMALCAVQMMDLGAAKLLVYQACDGKSFAHLGLADLAKLGDLIAFPGDLLETHIRDAVMAHRPWLLFVPDGTHTISFYTATHPDPALLGTICGEGVSFAALGEEARALASHPRWSKEIAIVRDEPEALLVRFPCVPER